MSHLGTQFGTPIRRAGGEIDVYTALLGVATLVLVAGIIVLCAKNLEHTKATDNDQGGLFKLVE